MLITRRTSLSIAAASVLTALSACHDSTPAKPKVSTPLSPTHRSTPTTQNPASRHELAAQRMTKEPLPPTTISALPPSRTPRVALTIDDGISVADVTAYAKLCHETGMRLTFFANGCYDSWRQAKPLLAPLVESGQVVIGNHTWNHPALTSISDAQIAWQMSKNDEHFRNLYGIKTLKPFARPPYGYINARVHATLTRLGYRGIVMWAGTLGDDQNIRTAAIEANARTWIRNGAVVIGHANHPGTADAVETVGRIIEQRKLHPVTVADVWQKPVGN